MRIVLVSKESHLEGKALPCLSLLHVGKSWQIFSTWCMRSGCTPTYLPFWISFNLGSSEKCDFETDLCKPLHEASFHPGWIRRNGNSGVGPPYSDHNGNDSSKNPCLHWRNHGLLQVIYFSIICLNYYFLDRTIGFWHAVF